ncbi:MAG: hypothetical protein HC817_15575 [Saprospiraceae bacterium]|nr:hypothetical protein [Saprospiraceae bacterium]
MVQDQTSQNRLPSAWGGEIGVQAHPLSKMVISAAFWGLTLDNELVFIGDEGTTENGGASRRIGVDLSLRASLTNWLYFDADMTVAKGDFTDRPFGKILEEDHIIPLAPNFTAAGGISWRFPAGIEGALRYRYVGNRAANESNTVTAEGYGLIDFNCFYKKGDINWVSQLKTY